MHEGKNSIEFCYTLHCCLKYFVDYSHTALYHCLSQIQKMGLQPADISMFSTLMDLVKEARELAEQSQ